MSKLVDIETIRKEFEHRMGSCQKVAEDERNAEWADHYRGKSTAYGEARDFLDTLPEEKPVDLEKEIVLFIADHYYIKNDETLVGENGPLTTFDFQDIAGHFYELGRKG